MGRCRRHPHHLVVGVCAHCLNDRLLALLKEDVVELAEHGDFQSAHIRFSSQMSPIGLSSSVPTGIMSQPPPTTARVASMESNRDHVKHMAASYLKRHQSLTSSPQYQPMISASPLFDAGPRTPPIINNNHFSKGEITRKKNSSLWSLLHRHRDDRTIDNRHDYRHEGRHEHRDYHDGMRVYGGETSEYNVMPKSLRRRRLGSSWLTKEAGGYDSHGYGDKLSYSTSVKEDHGSICRGNASSLVSSPHFSSPKLSSKQACHPFPSPTSKYVSQSPLNNERYGDENASPGRQHGSFAFNRHIDNYRGHYSSSSSWISSFFPRRNRRSKSISGTGTVGQQANRHSSGASPDMAPRRKKRVSFNADEDVIESPICKAMKSPQGNVNGVYRKSPPDLHEHVNGVYTKSPDMHEHGHEHINNPKPLKSPKSSFYGVFSKSAIRQEHVHVGEGNADAVAYLSDANALKSPRSYLSSDTTALKSPRAKLSSLLTKRRSGTVSIDCGRDVRVSPVPMLTVKRDDLSHHHLLHGGNCHQNHHHHQHHGHHQHYHPQRHHQGYSNDETVPKPDLQKSPKMDSINTMPSEKAFLKTPRFAALSAMNQLLKSPKLASVKTKNLDSEEDGKDLYSHSTSWRKSLSKTLSPMLALKNRKKQAMGHDGFHHPQHGHHDHHHNDKLQNHHDGPDTQHGHHNHHHIEPQHSHHDQHHSDHQLDHQHYQHGHGPNKAEESLVRETHVLPAKGPPQQYSFLSKDYSAFSFYFSPRHSGNADGAAYTSCKSSVPAGNGSPWSSYPSLTSRAGGGGIDGRGRF